MMRFRMGAVWLMGLGLGIAGAVAQQQPAPQGQMGGMDMNAGHANGKPAMPAGPLKISFGDKSAEWTPEALAALPHKTVTVHNAHTKADETYSGVPLIDLLVKLDVPGKPHGKELALYLVATGSDGYKAVYSVAEVNPDVHDATVIVADGEDGKPIAADGPLKLVATGETRPARWVRNLVAVQVLQAQ
ncbi:MAG: hypothetical protein WA802_02395 [Terracidiphilus sp.]